MKLILPIVAALIGLLAWTLLSFRLPVVLLPSPWSVLLYFGQHGPELATATLNTAIAALGGLGLALVAGVLGAIAFARSRLLEIALYPYAILIQTLPVVAIAPLLVIWLGYGTPVAIASAALVAFFPLLTAAHMGLRSVDPAQLELVRLYGASWVQELFLLRIPGALPHFFAGLRTAGGLAVIGAIVGEFVGSNGVPPSLGYLVIRSARSADTPQTFAAIICAAALALFFFILIRGLEWKTIGRWHALGPE